MVTFMANEDISRRAPFVQRTTAAMPHYPVLLLFFCSRSEHCQRLAPARVGGAPLSAALEFRLVWT
jgi:hypothetical protein